MAKRSMIPHSRQFRTVMTVAGALAVALLLVIPRRQEQQHYTLPSTTRMTAAATDVKLAPTYEVIQGTEVVWQKPSKPAGVLLAFHGCQHSATDWWPNIAACPKCIGLPEEVRITSAALARHYVVLAFSSSDRPGSRCWDVPLQPDKHSSDTRAAVAVLTVLLPREGLQGLPLFALGASSGGAFVLTLPAYVPLAGVCSQIMSLPPNMYKSFLQAPVAAELGAAAADAPAVSKSKSSSRKAGRQPPVLFVPMERDERTAAGVEMDVAVRKELGLVSRVLQVKRQPVTPAFLAERVPELAAGDSAAQLVQLLVGERLLDSSTHHLLADPRSVDWQQAVRRSSLPGASSWPLTPDASPLSEVLNVAWAQHEIVSDTTDAMLDWFEQQQ